MNTTPELHCDVLIIGSGAAGLSLALRLAEHQNVIVLSKGPMSEGSTFYAQGGIAAVFDETDSIASHVEDTLIAGAGIVAEHAAEFVARNARHCVQWLIDQGVLFDTHVQPNGEESYHLTREGGHSHRRILHAADATGKAVETTLVSKALSHPNIRVLERSNAVDLIISDEIGLPGTRRVVGAWVWNRNKEKGETCQAKAVVLATGGASKVYQYTTNPDIASGDGIAMVYRAKGTVKDMEFVQFHPTALYHPGDRPSFLITEAMRGYGGVLRTMDGKEFMQKYDPRLSLAPRDIVARAIDNEMKNRGDDHVYLDVTHKDPEETKKHFPNIYEKCLSLGIDITKDYIPVAPAAHYLCGGILVDLDGQSSIERLYAVGECSCTGLHGGNRLASNSLIEAVVYADAAAKHSLQAVDQYSYNEDIPEWNDEGTRSPEEMVLITQSMKEVNQIMSTYVGIVRSDLRLKRAWDRLDIIYEETESLFKRSVASREICELRNMVNVGYLIMRQAMERKESRGLHYTIDYPHVKK